MGFLGYTKLCFVKGTFDTTDLMTLDENTKETTVSQSTKGFTMIENGKLFAINNNNFRSFFQLKSFN